MAAVERSHIGFRGPSSVSLGKHHDPSQLVNQLQFNFHAPYAINSLASNFQKPQPLVIEKFPMFPPSQPTTYPMVHHGASIPSSPASSVSSERMHLAMQFAKIDAKKLWKEQKELKELGNVEEKAEIKGNNLRKEKATQGKGAKKSTQDTRRTNVGYVQYKSKKDHDVKRNLHESQLVPNSDGNVGPEEKQTREVRRLERQIQSYLQRLEGLIHKGHEVIQKKDKRLHVRRSDKDDRSHLSDEDTDPRQYERAEEQATRSARVLYMIERQIQQLDDEIRKKGRNMKQSKKSQTLGRLAAAQRATVRALRMLINSAPLQPKNSRHYPSIYQELTSLIQQLSLLAIQIEGGDEGTIVQNGRFDSPFKKRSEERSGVSRACRIESPKIKTKSNSNPAFSQEPAEKEWTEPSYTRGPRYQPLAKETFPDDSTLTVDATPERNATLKAGLEALLRAKELERKRSKPQLIPAANTKKKSVLLPQGLQAKRKKAHAAVQKTVKFPNETAHFTKDTTASRLKKVERQKTAAKGEMKYPKNVDDGVESGASHAVWSEQTKTRSGPAIDHQLHEREIQRQLWLEDETKRKLRDVMDIPRSLVSEAEEAIKMKLKPILDQAQAVVENSKSKPVQERFANIASKTTMQENEVLSEMILDDLLLDTAQEFQRLESKDEVESEASYLQNSSTLENILQRLEHFEKEEESIRRHLSQVSYIDTYETKQRRDIRQYQKERRENVFTKEKDMAKTIRAVKPSAVLRPEDKPPMPLILPPNFRDSIFSYREKYSEYLKQTNAENHGSFDPWQFVEKLSDDILEEMIQDVANEFTGACDDVTEMIFKSEFMKE